MNIIGNQLVEWIARFDLLASSRAMEPCETSPMAVINSATSRSSITPVVPASAARISARSHARRSVSNSATTSSFHPDLRPFVALRRQFVARFPRFLRRFTVDFDQIGVDVAAQRTGVTCRFSSAPRISATIACRENCKTPGVALSCSFHAFSAASLRFSSR